MIRKALFALEPKFETLYNVFLYKRFIFSVSSLPALPNPNFYGARALPSFSGNGVYLQSAQFFYELSCNVSSCIWRVMEQQLKEEMRVAVMIYLSPGFASENCSPDPPNIRLYISGWSTRSLWRAL